MSLIDTTKEYINQLEPVLVDDALKQRLFSLIDLTSLNDADSDESIGLLCNKAEGVYGYVAAVCVAPAFVGLVASQFAGTPVQVATVANFPTGDESLENVLIEINRALDDEANEIDVVFPYNRYLAGDKQYAIDFVSTCKAAVANKAKLKVILETSALQKPTIIAEAARDVLRAGADFVKTSTGKHTRGASLEDAAILLLAVKELRTELDRPLGVKVSGGIKDLEQAAQFVALADRILGRTFVTPHTFRIGASQLVDRL